MEDLGRLPVTYDSSRQISTDIALPAARKEPPFPPSNPLRPPPSTVSPVWKPKSLGARGNYSM
ncbi:hypothetical protein EYF80_011289 [Liparis tanakae]|uniref:Uncharacterized protein n=1 Tax=Liparis tanakae TaxID=230148 RepID=A0A4Z2IKS4_9TELE|nr:hypothetical protein EYF80_011289 [Liparis tanakae]